MAITNSARPISERRAQEQVDLEQLFRDMISSGKRSVTPAELLQEYSFRHGLLDHRVAMPAKREAISRLFTRLVKSGIVIKARRTRLVYQYSLVDEDGKKERTA